MEYQVIFFLKLFDNYHSTWRFSSLFFSVGLCVVQARLLFNLPFQFGPYPHPLAYIKWFTCLGALDPNTGLHSVTHSTCQAQRNVEIVLADRIVRGCHFMPRFGQSILSSWTTANVLELESIQYFINPYINVDSFTLLKHSLFVE